MSSSYPGAFDELAARTDDSPATPDSHATDHTDERDAINAIQSTLGLNPEGGEATVVARLDAIDDTISGIELTPGPQGPQGEPGQTGATGAPGNDGADGATWRSGSGVPSNTLGVDGDYYLRTSNGDVYLKTGGVYGVVVNLTGPAGEQGPAGDPGIDGADGANGATWRSGSGVPSNTLGVDGDYYLDTDNGDVYLRNAGTYSVVANIAGPAGNDGAAGAAGADGADGNDGADGATWRSGSAAPSNTLGVDGDYYLDTDNGDVYLRNAGTYSVVTNITGPAGEAGAAGAQGDTGPQGPSGVAIATAPLTYDAETQTVALATGNGLQVVDDAIALASYTMAPMFVLNEAGTATDNVFTSFTDLYAILSTVTGPKTVSVVGSATIAADTYDLSDVTFLGNATTLNIEDSTVITSWDNGGIGNGVQLVWMGTAPAWTIADGSVHRFTVGRFAAIVTSTDPFISVESSSTLAMTLDIGAGIVNAGAEVINLDTASIDIFAFGGNMMSNDVFSGDLNGGSATLYLVGPNSFISPLRSDANLTGTISLFPLSSASLVGYDPSVSGLGTTNVQETIDQIATATGIQYDPTISGLSSTNVKDAIDEVSHATGIQYSNLDSGLTAVYVQAAIDEQMASSTSTYDNTDSGLTATNVQDAIDELKSIIDNL